MAVAPALPRLFGLLGDSLRVNEECMEALLRVNVDRSLPPQIELRGHCSCLLLDPCEELFCRSNFLSHPNYLSFSEPCILVRSSILLSLVASRLRGERGCFSHT